MKIIGLCNSCCSRLDVDVTLDIVSECHRKYCWGCGWSSDSGLTSCLESVAKERASDKGELK